MELLAFWEGQFNTTALRELFQVTREHASRDINAYIEQHPRNIFYHRRQRAYLPGSGFKPQISSGSLSEYVALVQRLRDDAGTAANADLMVAIPEPAIAVDPLVVRSIIMAIRQRKRVSVMYRSWNHPQGKHRYIHPHAIAHSGMRWHCRAYGEEHMEFRDFALGRFQGPAIDCGSSDVDPKSDCAWFETITLKLAPNPALSDQEKELVRSDYGLGDDTLSVGCRACMAQYLLNAYQVDVHYVPGKDPRPARAQPLVLQNKPDIVPHLFTLS